MSYLTKLARMDSNGKQIVLVSGIQGGRGQEELPSIGMSQQLSYLEVREALNRL